MNTGTVLTAYSWGRGAKGREKKREIDSSCLLSMALVKTAYFEIHCHELVRYFYHYAEFHSTILFVTTITAGKITAKWMSDMMLKCPDLQKL